MNRKEKSYSVLLSRCDEIDVTPIFDIEDFKGIQVGTNYPKYKVRCNLCGNEYFTTFRRGHMLKCLCHSSSMFNRAKLYAERSGFDLIETKEELKGMKGLHPVKCKVCGKISYHRIDGIYFKCECQKFNPYKIAVSYCNSNNLELLLTESEYRGRTEKVPVRCKLCGYEYMAKVEKDKKTPCPGCKIEGEYVETINNCELMNLAPLFTKDEFKGHYSADGKSIYYKVKCKICQTEYDAAFGVNKYPNLCPSCKKSNYRSQCERVLSERFKDFKCLSNYKHRDLTFGGRRSFELDLYFPEYNIAFEFNGYYWHSDLFHDRFYHKEKTEVCLRNGIKLYHLWEDTDLELMISIIENKLGISKRVFARKCLVFEDCDSKFFEDNHVDGSCRFLKSWSLSYNGVKVCSLAYRRSVDNKPEIARFATKRGYEVVGGYSKLLSKMKDYLKIVGESELITYCNRDLSPDPMNSFYSKYGFKFIGDSGPTMKYYVSSDIDVGSLKLKRGVYPRQRLQKRIIVEALKADEWVFDESASEGELARLLNAYRVYNSGNFKYLLKL